MLLMNSALIFFLIFLQTQAIDSTDKKTSLSVPEHLIIVSTLEGYLYGISKYTGRVKWKMKEEPIVKVPANTKGSPIFMPDPKDGSLYGYGGSFQGLKKFPFSIPYLVSHSPCRSTEGLLYTGAKKDMWVAIDLKTGQKLHTLTSEGDGENMCPNSSGSAFYIGRTEYSLSMYDSLSKSRRWNATYFDYSVYKTVEPDDYDIRHFSSSSSGLLVTVEKQTGRVLWDRDLGSPVISVFDSTDLEGLTRLPVISMATETLEHLIGQLASVSTRNKFLHSDPKRMFFNTLYVGTSENGPYALSSWVDETTVSIEPRNGNVPRLPASNDSSEPSDQENTAGPVSVIVGHHEKPDESHTHLRPTMPQLPDNHAHREHDHRRDEGDKTIESASEPWYSQLEYTHIVSTGAFICFVITAVYVYRINQKQDRLMVNSNPPSMSGSRGSRAEMMQRSQQTSEGISSHGSEPLLGDHLPGANILEHLADGTCRVDHITFNPQETLGHGCSGTVVYKGKFDERDCAVKRVLPGLFSFVDREVQLLRESDQHANVIRYYCMVADTQFRYLALELCSATVQEYVEKAVHRDKLEPREVLRQATSGLQHLHSIGIVHRDVKPHNVLLTMPDQKQQVRVVISDFGLCKKLPDGCASMSHRSGVTGTEGWMAPELLTSDSKTSAAVDVFSLGCVFYYVLSGGIHPFGVSYQRQHNISAGQFNIDKLDRTKSDMNLSRVLIRQMLSSEPKQRPSMNQVLHHPMFWTAKQQLAFFQDVSDRVEKEPAGSAIVVALNWEGAPVVKMDWRKAICPLLQEDLRKFRSYQGDSVKDLLRAMRNKRHHYNELPTDVQQSLGTVPNQFLRYFTSRFPGLLAHVYTKLEAFKHEPLFSQYYGEEST